MFEPEKLMQQYEKLHEGVAKLSGIRYAIEQADLAKDYGYMLYFRYVYADSCGQYGDGLLRHIFYVFPEMLKLFEDHPDILMPDCCYLTAEEAVWMVFSWLVDCGDYFYQIPLSDMEQYFEKFKSFSLEYGHNLDSYYVSSARFFFDVDKEKAMQSFEAYKKFNRERHIKNAETIAFECEMEVNFHHVDKALNIIKPLIEGKYQNDLRLCFEYGRFFCYYLIHGQDMEKAGQFYRLMEGLRKKLHMRPIVFGDTILYLVLTDFDSAWKFYKKEAFHQAQSTISLANIEFALSTVIIMKYLSKCGQDEVHLRFPNGFPYYKEDGCYQTNELAAYCDKEARELSARFDARNGNQEFMDDYKLRLTLANLWSDEAGLIDLYKNKNP